MSAELRVVRGQPTAQELAALVVVLTGRPTAEPHRAPAARWSPREQGLRRPLPHGPGAWRQVARATG